MRQNPLNNNVQQNNVRNRTGNIINSDNKNQNIGNNIHHNENHAGHQGHKHVHKPKKSFLNLSFLLANILIIGFGYLFITQFLLRDRLSSWLPLLIVFSLIYFMVLWTYYKTVCSSPGQVPPYFGLSDYYRPDVGNAEGWMMPRIYCTACHNFKPERTHHCSACQKCVLNMDHHCPWVNNCIGFMNRKYFLLFLFWIGLGLIYCFVIQTIVIIRDSFRLKDGTYNSGNGIDKHFIIKLIVLLYTMIVGFSIIVFGFHHLFLVLNNVTTLEGLKKIKKQKQLKQKEKMKKSPQSPQQQPLSKTDIAQTVNVPNSQNQDQKQQELPPQVYNIGRYLNFTQVFGTNPVAWLLPVYGIGPNGDGIFWPKDYSYIQNVPNNKIIYTLHSSLKDPHIKRQQIKLMNKYNKK